MLIINEAIITLSKIKTLLVKQTNLIIYDFTHTVTQVFLSEGASWADPERSLPLSRHPPWLLHVHHIRSC